MPFYNCHIHIFSTQCAPRRFLEVGLPSWLDFASGGIRGFLETRMGRGILNWAKKRGWSGRKTKVMARYANFLSIGTMASQKLVFRNILPYYPPDTRFVVLTLNMDYMGAGKSELTFQGQVDEVIELRRLYPDTCLPFLSIDPRAGSADSILQFVQQYVGAARPFVGIKLYPALGFFPYDARLEKMYQYCEDNGLPIMTHCTASGAFFLGPLDPSLGLPQPIGQPTGHPCSFGQKVPNDLACDFFLEPQRWQTVLDRFPRLKVCFAHMSGMVHMWKRTDTPNEAHDSWYDHLLRLMGQYKNVYTDISYTLADKEKNFRTWGEIRALLKGEPGNAKDPAIAGLPHYDTIRNRILFGTDYFMTEQEDSEARLAQDLPNWLLREEGEHGLKLLKKLTEDNPERYLRSNFYQPQAGPPVQDWL